MFSNISKKIIRQHLLYKCWTQQSLSFSKTLVQCQTKNVKIEKHSDEKSSITENINIENLDISTKLQKKLPKKEPLLKNFFLGIVDTDLLAYPETIPKDELNNLNKNIEKSINYFENNLNSKDIELTRLIPKSVINELQEIKLFGTNITQNWGGRGYYLTENSLSSEIEANDVNITTLINAHRVVSDIIMDCGTEDQKNKYLPRLAKGELIGTMAIYETEFSETGAFNTKAVISREEDFFMLNGEKSYIINGNDASLYIVLAHTIGQDKLGDTLEGVSVFLVDASSPGIIKSSPDITIGCRGVKQTKISFNNVAVRKENLIGELNNGGEIGQKILKLARIQSGIINTAQMKKILSNMTDYCMNQKISGVSLNEFESIRETLSKITCYIYATESMTYLTTELIDGYENQDVDLETAAIRAFSLEKLWKTTGDLVNNKGPESLLSGQDTDILFRDAAQLLSQRENLASLKLFIGLSGLQHAGLNVNDTVKKVRNPLFHPGFIFGRMFDRRNIDDPKLTLKLNENLHPTLDPASQWLELSILRLQMGTDILLARYGSQIMEKHIDIIRLADCIILIYAMFASVARASRSYCIGLKHSDYEMLIASSFCLDSTEKIKTIITEIAKGPFVTNDMNHQKIGTQLFKSKGYFLEHPTKQNF